MTARFYLLGRLRLQMDQTDEPTELPSLRKAQALLAYLLLFRSRPHRRELLADLFWNEVPEELARNSLTKALGAIRVLLPATGLQLLADRFTVQLDLGTAWLDVASLESGLARDATQDAKAAALGLYRADLLADWQDEWVIIERERLRRLVLNVGTELLRNYLDAKQWHTGITLAEQLIEHDPLDSALHGLLLSLLLGSGQRDTARRHYQQHAALMRTELGLDPSGVSWDAYSQLITASGSQVAEGVAQTAAVVVRAAQATGTAQMQLPFGDRVVEQARLQSALTELRQGRGGLVLLRGEAGIGKTRLVEEALATTRGLHVARGRAFEFDKDTPFGVLLRPLSTWLLEDLAPNQVLSRLGPATAASITQLIPALAARLPMLKPLPQLPQAEAQMQLVQSIVGALLAAGKPPGAPAVLFIDDLHFADIQTLQVLAQVQQHLQSNPLLVLATYRPEEVLANGPLDQLLNSLERTGAYVLDVKPLGLDDVRMMVEPREPEPILSRWLHSRSRGNPFFLAELVHGLADTGHIAPDTALGGWYLVGEPLPEEQTPLTASAQAAVLERFERMSPPAKTICQILAAFAGEVDFYALALASSLDEEEALNGIEEAIKRRFVRQQEDEQHYLIEHDLIRSAIYQSLSPLRKRFLHGRIATTIEVTSNGNEDPSLLSELAFHYARSANKEKQQEYFWKAANSALDGYSPGTALDYYRRLLPLLAGKGSWNQRLEVYRRIGSALRLQGRNAEAAETYMQMRAHAAAAEDSLSEARALNGLSIAHSYLGDDKASLHSAQRAAEIARQGGPPLQAELAHALIHQGWVYLRAGQAEDASSLGSEALAMGWSSKEKSTVASALNLLATAADALGSREEAFIYYEQALTLSNELGHWRRSTSLLSNLAGNKYWQGDYQAAYGYASQALTLARKIDNRDAEIIARSYLGASLVELGDSRAAELELRRAIQMSEQGANPYTLPYVYLALGKTLLDQNQVPEALSIIARAHELGQVAGDWRSVGITWRLMARVIAMLPEATSADVLDHGVDDAFAQSLHIFSEHGPLDEYARTLRAWSSYEAARRNYEQADKYRQKAIDIFGDLGLHHEVKRTTAAGK